MEMDLAMDSQYSGDTWVDRHHFIISKRHSIIPSTWSYTFLQNFYKSMQCVWFLTYSCEHSEFFRICIVAHALLRAFNDPCNLCGWSWLGTHSYPQTLFLHSLSQNCSFTGILFRCHQRWGRVLMMDTYSWSSTFETHSDRVNVEMYVEAMIEKAWRCNWRTWSS